MRQVRCVLGVVEREGSAVAQQQLRRQPCCCGAAAVASGARWGPPCLLWATCHSHCLIANCCVLCSLLLLPLLLTVSAFMGAIAWSVQCNRGAVMQLHWRGGSSLLLQCLAAAVPGLSLLLMLTVLHTCCPTARLRFPQHKTDSQQLLTLTEQCCCLPHHKTPMQC